MNESYSEYINSEEWKKKRAKVLGLYGFCCASCGKKRTVEVHHLTYARIFQENDDDLLPLCFYHHTVIEKLVASGHITKNGNPSELKELTLRLLNPDRKSASQVPSIPRGTAKNRVQERLIGEAWFNDALNMKRDAFKKLLHWRFRDEEYFNSCMANAFALYHRLHKKTKRKKFKEWKRPNFRERTKDIQGVKREGNFLRQTNGNLIYRP